MCLTYVLEFQTNDDQNSTRTLADISSSKELCNVSPIILLHVTNAYRAEQNNIGNVVVPNALLGHTSNDEDDEVSLHHPPVTENLIDVSHPARCV